MFVLHILLGNISYVSRKCSPLSQASEGGLTIPVMLLNTYINQFAVA